MGVFEFSVGVTVFALLNPGMCSTLRRSGGDVGDFKADLNKVEEVELTMPFGTSQWDPKKISDTETGLKMNTSGRDVGKNVSEFLENFAPIPADATFNGKPTILLPLIADGIQTLSILPTYQAYDRGQYINQSVVPPEGEFNRIVIKAIEPIQRKEDEHESQVQPLVFERYQLPTKPNNQTLIKSQTEKPKSVSMIDLIRRMDVGQQTVNSSGQEVFRGVENREKPELWLMEIGLFSPVFENKTGDKGGVRSRVETVFDEDDDDGLRLEHKTKVSVQEVSGKSADKVCFILNKD